MSVADASGNALALNTYDEYGAPGTSNSGRFQYTGQAWIAELGLYYYRARFYSPQLGRFLQTDPIGYSDDLNLYAYVYNDPLDKADPSGLCGEQEDPCPGEGGGNYDQEVANHGAWMQGGAETDLGSFALASAPGIGEYLAVSDFIDHPSWLGAAVIGASIVDAGGLVKDAAKGVKATGSYDLKFASGKKYAGKGPASRMEHSAKELSETHDDPVLEKTHDPAPNEREAFKAEHKKIEANGGPQSEGNTNTYNKINSPGKKMCEEDYQPCP